MSIAPVRPKRVTLMGAESTGKTTLANTLARHYGTVVAPEYGRTYTEEHGQDACSAADMLAIAQGHLARRHEAEQRASRILIEDTDPVITAVWSDTLAGARDPWFATFHDYPDLYLLCDIDLPWVKDGVRYFGDPQARRAFHDAIRAELVARGQSFVLVSGDAAQRFAIATRAIDALLL